MPKLIKNRAIVENDFALISEIEADYWKEQRTEESRVFEEQFRRVQRAYFSESSLYSSV